MKPTALLPLILAAALPLSAGPDPAPLRRGDDVSRMREVLGEPNGYIESGTWGLYRFDRGRVRTRHGKVDVIHLISEEELAARRSAERLARRRRTAEGEALLAQLRENGLPASMSGREQAAFWDRFRREYPGVDPGVLHLEARARAAREIEAEQKAERLAGLERRVRQAEQAAELARAEAARARQAAEQQRTRYVYGVGISPWGYVNHRPRPDCDTRARPVPLLGRNTTTLSWRYR